MNGRMLITLGRESALLGEPVIASGSNRSVDLSGRCDLRSAFSGHCLHESSPWKQCEASQAVPKENKKSLRSTYTFLLSSCLTAQLYGCGSFTFSARNASAIRTEAKLAKGAGSSWVLIQVRKGICSTYLGLETIDHGCLELNYLQRCPDLTNIVDAGDLLPLADSNRR